MNINYLKEFTVLANAKNYWEASERLYINQSTLSKHIKAMEAELGVPLFTRTTRRVELTKYGEALLPYAQSIARTEFQYSALLMQMQNQDKDLLTLGTIPTMAQYDITKLFLQFKQLFPESSIKIIEEDANQLPELLLSHKCELIFTRETRLDFEKKLFYDDQLTRIPYMKDYMIALLHRNHPMAGRSEIALRELKDEHFCLIKENSMIYNLCVDACQAANFIPNIVFTSHRLESIFDMVSNGDHIALLMNRHVRPIKKTSFANNPPWVPVPVVPSISTQLSLCYLKNVTLSKTAKNFVAFCEQEFLKNKTTEGL